MTLCASAREMVLPAGTLLQCTLNEPNFSSATVAVGDPVLCHLRSLTEFGHQAFPRESYLVGHLESSKDPGHFWGKGYMKIVFDRIGMPQGDMPLDAKVVATRGYKVDKYGDIDGKGHAKRDLVEWMIPPLWPWKIIMLPARGPRPTLKGEAVLTLRLMDDVQLPQVAQTFGPDWHFFGDRPPRDAQYENDAYYGSLNKGSLNNNDAGPRLASRQITPMPSEPMAEEPAVRYATYTTKAPPVSLAGSGAAGAKAAGGSSVFVLKTGLVLAVSNYTYQDGRISYELASGGSGVVSTDEVDWTTTTQVNLQHGVRVALPAGHAVTATAGF
ncbi:MAG: hypothetical protein WAL71_02005 [Terriglobales bacterium]